MTGPMDKMDSGKMDGPMDKMEPGKMDPPMDKMDPGKMDGAHGQDGEGQDEGSPHRPATARRSRLADIGDPGKGLIHAAPGAEALAGDPALPLGQRRRSWPS